MNKKGLSSILATLMLIVIVVVAGLLAYLWIMGFIPRRYGEQPREIIKVEGVKIEGNIAYIYVRNLGSKEVVVSSVYLTDSKGLVKYQLSLPVFQSGTEIWGGDVWKVSYSDLKVIRIESGKILYDKFTSQDLSTWDDSYVDYNNAWDAVYYDSDGLKLLSRSKGGWAVRGLITTSTIVDLIDPESYPVVIEVDLQKTNYNVPAGDAAGSPFAACMYLSYSKKSNPYFANPWFAVKLYPRSGPSRTEAQLVSRDSSGTLKIKTLYTWYSAPNTQPRGVFLLIFNETGKVYYYFWRNSRQGEPYKKGSWTSTGLQQVLGRQVYIYLTIDNLVTVSSRKVHVRYIQVYRGTKIKITNLGACWTVNITDNTGNIIFSRVAGGPEVEVDLLDYILEHGMPLIGHIYVIPCNVTEYNTYGGWVIPPKEVREIVVSLPSGLSPGTYTIKVITKRGTEASIVIKYG